VVEEVYQSKFNTFSQIRHATTSPKGGQEPLPHWLKYCLLFDQDEKHLFVMTDKKVRFVFSQIVFLV
jgi:hypothetical protein